MKRMYFWMLLILMTWGCEKQDQAEGAKESQPEKMSPIEELIKKADTGQPETLSFELEAQQGSLRRNLFENEPLLFCRRIGSLTKQGLSLSTPLVRQTCMEQDRIQIRLDEAEAKARDWEDRINKVEVDLAMAELSLHALQQERSPQGAGSVEVVLGVDQQLGPGFYLVRQCGFGVCGGDRYVLRSTGHYRRGQRIQVHVAPSGTEIVTQGNDSFELRRFTEVAQRIAPVTQELVDAGKDVLRLRSELQRLRRLNDDGAGYIRSELGRHLERMARIFGPTERTTGFTSLEELAPFMQLVCEDEVHVERERQVVVSCACPAWTQKTDDPEDALKLTNGYFGNFSGDGLEVFLSFEGCAAGFNFEGMLALLGYRDGEWRVLSTNHETDIRSCTHEVSGQRHALICVDNTMGGGSYENDVTMLDVHEDKPSFSGLYREEGSSAACHFVGVFETRKEVMFYKDLDGDSQDELVIVMMSQTGRVSEEEEFDDPCEVVERGKVEVSLSTQLSVLKKVGPRWEEVADASRLLAHPELEQFKLEPTPYKPYKPDAGYSWGEVDALLRANAQVEAKDPKAWPLYERRIAALSNSMDVAGAEAFAYRTIEQFPDKSVYVLVQLAELYEAAEKFKEASEVYERLLADKPSSATRGRAAWFYASAPEPFRSTIRASELINVEEKSRKPDERAIAASVQLSLLRGDAEGALALLKALSGKVKTPGIAELRATLEGGETSPSERPRPARKALMHRVPGEWHEGVPHRGFGAEERLFLTELVAIEDIRMGRFDHASDIYSMLLRHTRNPDIKLTFQLGLGKAKEGLDPTTARFYYQNLLINEADPQRRARVLNRLAWFLLTNKAEHNLERGKRLAEESVELTKSEDPSVLDTLAEAAIQSKDTSRARELLERCIALDPERPYYRDRIRKL